MSLWKMLFGDRSGVGIDGAEARQLVSEGAGLLDVRTKGEFDGGHLPDAQWIPVAELAGRVDEVPKDQTVIVYCRSGGRSARAAQILKSAGFEEVRDLGPMSAWSR